MTIQIYPELRITSDEAGQNFTLERLASATGKDGKQRPAEWKPWPRQNFHPAVWMACVYAMEQMPAKETDHKELREFVDRMETCESRLEEAVREAMKGNP